MTNNYDDEDDFGEEEELSITDEHFDSLDEILCDTCGEPSETRFLMEDIEFATILQVCSECIRELSEDAPERFRLVDGGVDN